MLASLTVRDFRNLEPLTWRPGAGSHLLVGGNGAGKTSLLEAIYLLATSKSFRSARLADCARHGGPGGFRLEGEAGGEGGAPVHLEVGWQEGAKTRAVNGRAASLGEHLAALPVVAWTAADADLTTGPPALRRRLLDRGVLGLHPAALDLLSRYRRALAAKRELLARGGASDREIAPWNELLATSGAEIVRLRRRYTARLAAELTEAVALADLPVPPITIAYRASPSALRLAEDPAEEGLDEGEEDTDTGEDDSYPDALFDPMEAAEVAEPSGSPAESSSAPPSPHASSASEEPVEAVAERLRAHLRRFAPRERRRGLPLVGPHRDELAIRWGGRPLRGTVSAGERKAAGLLLLAAHGRVLAAAGRPPVHLLDDADAELAAPTLAAVWRTFAGAGQLFASSNRPEVWRGIEVGARHHLEAGRLRPTSAP